MNSLPNRRDFLQTSVQAGLALAGLRFLASPRLRAVEPIQRSGGAHFKLSLVAYSFRNYMAKVGAAKKTKAESAESGKQITLFDVIDFCAEQGIAGIELTGYYFPQPTPLEYLIKLKRHAYLRGVAISGTSFGNKLGEPDKEKLAAQVAEVKTWVDKAAVLGAPYVRVFAGNAKTMKAPGALEAAIEGINACAEYAGTKGIFIGLENDGGLTPKTTVEIAKGVGSPWFGLNLDLGNFHTPDVYGDLVSCAPYAINVHFKTDIQEGDQPSRPADIARMLGILRQANYQGYLALEFESEGDPYKMVPPWAHRVQDEIQKMASSA